MTYRPLRASRLVINEDGLVEPRYIDETFQNMNTDEKYPDGIQLQAGIDRFDASMILRKRGIHIECS